ncbi:DUF1392 family protein [Nostoc sp. NMS8]|uniref:DUF1392 family protein n=1 Tax=Nostoc sp. NMS8 TaxID=2815392 RepID=UPI0025CE20D9|nr:DUF1392 family protein [Nostoc sp. NMS8]
MKHYIDSQLQHQIPEKSIISLLLSKLISNVQELARANTTVYVKSAKAFGYCTGVEWLERGWKYEIFKREPFTFLAINLEPGY